MLYYLYTSFKGTKKTMNKTANDITNIIQALYKLENLTIGAKGQNGKRLEAISILEDIRTEINEGVK
jgi:NADPH-dependent 7-cyano-7-deazaguanine reductase QueF